MTPRFGLDAIGGLGRKVAYGAVSPIIAKGLPIYDSEHRGLVEIKDREQLHGINAEIFEVRNLFDQAAESPGMPNARGRRLGEAADMRLINDAFLHRTVEGLVAFPIVPGGVNDNGAHGRLQIVLCSAAAATIPKRIRI